jgi:hypothetical protein
MSERAGVGKGTFYHYFATKEDVIVALRERFSRDFTDAVAEKIAACGSDDHQGRFAAWLHGAVELPAAVHRDLVAYAAALAAETGGDAISPEKLISPMLAKFMASDRGFCRRRGAANG